jgi:hypothetical protein
MARNGYSSQLVVLGKKLDFGLMGGNMKVDIVRRAIEGKVGGWGIWIGP